MWLIQMRGSVRTSRHRRRHCRHLKPWRKCGGKNGGRHDGTGHLADSLGGFHCKQCQQASTPQKRIWEMAAKKMEMHSGMQGRTSENTRYCEWHAAKNTKNECSATLKRMCMSSWQKRNEANKLFLKYKQFSLNRSMEKEGKFNLL